ncbi:hypothetical protein SLEP1_g58158 [Rubroshorea leprosula]|uniref:Uncharacterized protein n=1 Tax=Rubroshorea leprosula TaxID=152421 RepID=A0AAV5MRQ0_9ROSI|nr:hypothetical protein SLEP1_g58158 [Rubroshorea leprosula]
MRFQSIFLHTVWIGGVGQKGRRRDEEDNNGGGVRGGCLLLPVRIFKDAEGEGDRRIWNALSTTPKSVDLQSPDKRRRARHVVGLGICYNSWVLVVKGDRMMSKIGR